MAISGAIIGLFIGTIIGLISGILFGKSLQTEEVIPYGVGENAWITYGIGGSLVGCVVGVSIGALFTKEKFHYNEDIYYYDNIYHEPDDEIEDKITEIDSIYSKSHKKIHLRHTD